MSDLFKRRATASKLIEFGALQHIVNDINRRDNRTAQSENQTIIQGQGKILLALSQEDHVAQKDLAAKLNLTAQSTAEFVRKLEKKRFVTREKLSSDRRVTIVSLTEAGRSEANKAVQEIPPFLEILSNDELDQLVNILTKVNNGMYQEIETANPTWFNKFHQMLTNHYLAAFHAGEKKK